MKKKRVTAMILATVMAAASVCGCGTTADVEQGTNEEFTVAEAEEYDVNDPWAVAEHDTYAAYPETVNYTIGIAVDPSKTYPEGWENPSPEHSAYTDFYFSKLNVKNTDYFEGADGDDYRNKVSMAIASGDLPDIMSVTQDELVSLVENDLVEDLSTAYANCAGDLMKKIYDSYDGRSLDMATFDGKLYALPTTQITNGPEMLWLRKDWMDKLGLAEPKTIEDIENIVTTFIEEDPGNNGAGKTVGIPLCTTEDQYLYGEYGSAYKVNNIFTSMGAAPSYWVENEAGEVEYGSVQPQMKEALTILADWYKKGLIDKEFSTRKYADVTSLITDGKCGSVFCSWWLPYDLAGSRELNPDAEWVAYIIPVGADGKVTMVNGNPNQDRLYQVVRKGFEHPELLVKLRSITLDYNQGDAAKYDDSAECAAYVDWVNHGYGHEFIGGFDWYDAVARSHTHIADCLDGKMDPGVLSTYEGSLYESCKAYIEAEEAGTPIDKQNWIDYKCRMEAAGQMIDADVNTVNPVFFGQTESMTVYWETLKTLERKTIMQIITGEQSVDSFDSFVDEWYAAGGDIITEEVAAKCAK